MAWHIADGRPSGGRPGRLKVFLGAAPGVGKTYRMLDEGRRRSERGTDVVVAYAECHGRRRTELMLEGLEAVPRAGRRYRGSDFQEMDLDAVIARRPAVALVDELAHTNVPGGRHAKRWQDVEELLAAGIDVVTSEYAVIAAEQSALERLSGEVADQIVTRVALYARQHPSKE